MAQSTWSKHAETRSGGPRRNGRCPPTDRCDGVTSMSKMSLEERLKRAILLTLLAALLMAVLVLLGIRPWEALPGR